jgi:hypothetical protein
MVQVYNLAHKATYEFKIAAVTSKGPGAFSAVSIPVTIDSTDQYDQLKTISIFGDALPFAYHPFTESTLAVSASSVKVVFSGEDLRPLIAMDFAEQRISVLQTQFQRIEFASLTVSTFLGLRVSYEFSTL